jgi:hypothetical protein
MAKIKMPNVVGQGEGQEDPRAGVRTVGEIRNEGDVTSVRKPRDIPGQNRDKIISGSPFRSKGK